MDPLEERAKAVSADGIRGDSPLSDIAEHQRAEEALRASESRYRSLFENHVAAIICNTLDGRIVECNDAAARILGYESPQEMLGLNIRDIHRDPAKRVDLIARLQAGKTRDEIEAKLWRKDGTPVWVIANLSLTRVDGTGETFIQGTMIDITERKMMEESLRESEERFRELVESTEVIMWEAIAATARLTFVSLGAEKILGYPAEQWLQTPGFWADHLHPEDRPEALTCQQEVTEKGKPRSVEYRMKAADGRVLWFRDLMRAVSGPGGKVERLRGIMVDITESKRAEDALRESEERYRQLFEVESDAILVVDVDTGRILDANTAALNLYGFSRGELLSVTAEEVSPEPHKTRAAIAQAGEHVQLRWHRKKDGTVFPVEISGGYFLNKGRRIHVAAIRDITERRRADEALLESDQRYRDFIEHSSEGVRRLEFEQPIPINLANEEVLKRILQYGYLAECNAAHAHHLGFATAGDLVGKRVGELLAASGEERVASLQTSARPGYQSQTFEVRRRDKTGAFRHLLRTEMPIVQNGMLMRVWGVTRDITELRQAENALRESEERFRLFMNNSPTAAWMKDEQGRYVYVSEANEQCLSVQMKDQLGKTDFEVYPPKIAAQFRKNDQAALDAGHPIEVIEESLTPDGKVSYWSTYKFPFQDASGKVFVAGIGMNITERKQAEDQLRKLSLAVEQSPVCVVITDAEGNIEYVNPKFTQLTGYAAEEAMGRNPRILKSGLVPAETYRQLWSTVLLGNEWRGEFANKKKNGQIYWESASIVPIRGSGGTITHLLAVKEDITERKRSETLLRESEERFRATFENAGIGMALVDKQRRPFKSNPALRQMLGYSEEELSGVAFTEFTHPEDRDLDRRLFCELVEGKRDKYEIEKRYLKKDGGVMWGLLTASVVKDEHGCPLCGVGMVQDITERKRAEMALREAETMLRFFVQHAPAPIAMLDREMRYLVVSRRWMTDFRLGDRELRGLSHYEVFPEIPEHWKEVHRRCLAGAVEQCEEDPFPRLDGRVDWVHWEIRPWRKIDNSIGGIIIFSELINERKWAEEALRESAAGLAAAQRTAHIGSWEWNVQTNEARWSEETFHIFGLAPGRLEEHRKGFLDMIHPEDKARVDRALGEAVNGTRKYDLDYRIQLPDGTEKVIHAQAETLRDEAGNPLRMQGIIQDITERKRMEKDLQGSLDQLRALAARLQSIREEERTRVARDIHDQLGQALTAIKIDMSSLVRDLPAGVEQSKRASSILQLVDESIQAVRRISTELRPGILDDLGLVAAVEWAGEDFQARTGTTCGLDLPQEAIAVDPEQATAIFRIFQETLTNVARHAHASQVEVRLARDDGDLTLEVQDDGKGMPEDRLMNIESLGILGMRERAMLLGGELTISSPPGKGTTVRVRIPEAHRT